MSNRFTSLSPACLRSQYRSVLIIAALCVNYLPFSVQAIIPLSDPGTRNRQGNRSGGVIKKDLFHFFPQSLTDLR
jgi:hypothetical protein